MVNYIINLLSTDIWEYEVFKSGLNYFNIVMQLGYPPEGVLTCLLKSFGKLQESLWHSVNTILASIHQAYGFEVFTSSLTQLHSPLADAGNPLNRELSKGLESGESKTVKNILLCL